VQLALKIRPQQSTQYGQHTEQLAPAEVRARPAGRALGELRAERFAGRPYLVAELDGPLEPLVPVLSRLACVSETFELLDGPLLRPLEPDFRPLVPVEMAEVRRYKGKTSDVFSHLLLNLALFAGAFAERCTDRMRVLDPLCGGGTTCFLALAHGHDALGIDLARSDVESTARFASAYFREERIPFKEVKERTAAGPRWRFEAGPRDDQRLLAFMGGDAREAAMHLHGVPGGARVHAIAGDLPYGIQHDGEVTALLREALPAWAELLHPGGAVALAWNATRLARPHVTELVAAAGLEVRDDQPYSALAHRVDRVIRQRDVVVAIR
jgi:SAM-dependent methyltransferase